MGDTLSEIFNDDVVVATIYIGTEDGTVYLEETGCGENI